MKEEFTTEQDVKNLVVKRAFHDSIPVMTGYIVLGIGFGMLLKSEGYGILWSLAMSVFIYAGSMQYVAVSLLASATPLITAMLTTLMVNARHLFYGISMTEAYKDAGRGKPYMIFGLTDETYSLVCHLPKDMDRKEQMRYSLLVTVFDHCYWVTGSVIGSLIPFSAKGIDFALTALFITIFTDQWLTTRNHFSAIAGVLASVACVLLFGSANFLIPAMIAISVILITGKKFALKEEKSK